MYISIQKQPNVKNLTLYIPSQIMKKHAKIHETEASMVDMRRKQMEIFSKQRYTDSDRSSASALFIESERHIRTRLTTQRQSN